MATDFLLLRRYPEKGYARFRAYGWHRPAFSFGYSQKIALVRAQLPAEAEQGRAVELVRRPTGGGLVDHREDWTFALVIPRGHDLEVARAVESYRAVHAALADALSECGQAAVLKERCEPEACDGEKAKGPTVCFTRPELYDVVHPESGVKIAGAAQKRTKEGLLFQGSIWRPAAGGVTDWDALQAAFVMRLAEGLRAEAVETPWPDFAEGELDGLVEQYSATEWTEAR
jgi:lipoate-protein ligase A